jgi:maltokinase
MERAIVADQSNTCVRLGEGLLVKCYRRLWPGVHPETELVARLGDRVRCVPRAWGTVVFRDSEGVEHALALVQEFVPDAVDGWAWGRAIYEALAAGAAVEPWGEALGGLTAELHRALVGLPGGRPVTEADRRAWQERGARELAAALSVVDPSAAARLREWAPWIGRELEALAEAPHVALTRIHGDLHVGQVLRANAELFVVDFEGEPTRPPEERRRLDSPLRDVASMLRSFEHVPRWVLRNRAAALPVALAWTAAEREAFVEAYRTGIAGTPLSLDPGLLRAFEVEKATYEFVYAAEFLPEWMPVAVGAMGALLAA